MFGRATGCRLAALAGVLAAACLAGADARAEGGKVTVRSSPAGAGVYLDSDEEPRGVTPLELTGIATGLHKVRVSLAGYAVQRRGFYLAPGGERVFSFSLKAAGDDEPKPVAPRREPRPRPEPEPREERPTPEKKEAVPKTIDVECPFCEGSKVMDKMGCSTCRGTGYVDINQCSKCSGSRRVDFACPFCKGEGRLVAGGKERECPKCKGEGNLPCPPCRGGGTIKRANPEAARYPTADCPYCNATGFLPEAKCTFCGGDGEMWIGRSDSGNNQGGGGGVFGGNRGGYGNRRKVSCPYCGGEGKGAPLCRRCQ
ncbi:MAG: PEGA domain-containing protein, partial [Planctomycetota bacterium]